MQLEDGEIMRILAEELEVMGRSIDESPNDDLVKVSLKGLFAKYTSTIARKIQEAENERVCSMLEGMEKYEFKTDDGEGSE